MTNLARLVAESGSPPHKPSKLRVIERIPDMTDESLLVLFKNCIGELEKGTSLLAQSVIEAIESEWRRRVQRTFYFVQLPKVGMLAALGYHVGQGGEKMPVRRRILKHVVEGELPVVSSIAYTAEWGMPLSNERIKKLVNVLTALIDGAKNDPTKKTAVSQWQADRDWLLNDYPRTLL